MPYIFTKSADSQCKWKHYGMLMIQRYSHRWYLSNDDTFDVYFRNENTSHGRSNRLIVGRKFAHEYHFNLVIAINRPAFIKSQFLLVLHWVNWKMTIGQMHKKKSNITMRNSTVCLEMSACQFSAPLKSWFSASFHVLHVLYDSIWLDTGACTMHMHITHQIISYKFYFPLKFQIFLKQNEVVINFDMHLLFGVPWIVLIFEHGSFYPENKSKLTPMFSKIFVIFKGNLIYSQWSVQLSILWRRSHFGRIAADSQNLFEWIFCWIN